MWRNDTLETTMDVVERRTHSLKGVSRTWNIPFTFHLNGKTKF
jgi:hypothetical protein